MILDEWLGHKSATVDEIEEILSKGDVETQVSAHDTCNLIFCELTKSRWAR